MNAYDRMQDAIEEYARLNGDGFRYRDYLGANDYCDEGYKLAEQAFKMPADEREDYIETEVEKFAQSERYVVSCSAAYRLSELEAEKPAPKTDWFAVATDIAGGPK